MFSILYLLDHYPLRLFLLHVALGIMLSNYSIISTVWGWSVVITGSYYILKYRNHYNAAGMIAAYLVGLEIVLRMTGANLVWEFGKYGTIALLILGLALENIKQHRTSALIVLYILSFLPSIFLVPFESFNIWRQHISFNLSGPFTLFISFLYYRNRVLTEIDFIRLLKMIVLPLVTMSFIIVMRTPALEHIVFGSEANPQMSGGYGPNQVSSSLGLVVAIIALSKILGYTLFKKNTYDYTLLGVCSIQAYLTFARGGVLTAILAIFSAWLISLGKSSSKTLRTGKITYVFIILFILWGVASNFSQGMMEKRYLSILDVNESGELSGSGRMLIMAADLDIFSDNIILGVGPGIGTELRADYGYNKIVAAHSEFTRVLAEHGLFGLLGLFAIILLSIQEYNLRKKDEKCILICFTTLAILTMLHSAMRLAMPGFLFGLAFVKIKTQKNILSLSNSADYK